MKNKLLGLYFKVYPDHDISHYHKFQSYFNLGIMVPKELYDSELKQATRILKKLINGN